MAVVLRLLDVAAVSWEADHHNQAVAAAEVDTAIVRSPAPITDCTAPDIVEFVIIAVSLNFAVHIN